MCLGGIHIVLGLLIQPDKISAKDYILMNNKDLTLYEMEIVNSLERYSF